MPLLAQSHAFGCLLCLVCAVVQPACQGSDSNEGCHQAQSPAGTEFCEKHFGTLHKWVCTDQTCPLIRIQKRGCVTLDLMQRAGYQPNDTCIFDPGLWIEGESTSTDSESTSGTGDSTTENSSSGSLETTGNVTESSGSDSSSSDAVTGSNEDSSTS